MSGGNCWNLRVTAEVNQGGRKYMEDVTSVQFERVKHGKIIVEYAAFAIYDGHGGKDAAYFARDHLLENIKLQKGFFSNDVEIIKKALSEAFVATHLQMWNKLPEWPKTSLGHPSTAGTTASLVIIRGNRMFVANVGDSMIVMGSRDITDKPNLSNRFIAKDLTIDHKPELFKERKRIEKSGGCVMNKSGVNRVVWSRPKISHSGPIRRSTKLDKIPFLAVARSLGDLWSFNSELNEFVVSPVPDVYVYDLHKTKEQFIVLASDGLWNMIRPQEAVSIVGDVESNKSKQNSGESPAHQLVQLALDRWKMRMMRADNTSVIVVIIERKKLATAKSSETYLESWTSAKVNEDEPDDAAPGEFHALHSKRRPSAEVPISSSAPDLTRENTDLAGPSNLFEPLQDSSISSSSGDVADDVYPALRSRSKRTSFEEDQPSSSGIKTPMLTRSQSKCGSQSAPPKSTKRKRSAGDTPSVGVKTRRVSSAPIPKRSTKSDVGLKTRSSSGGMSLRKRSKKSI